MDKKYKKILDIISADIQKVDENLVFDIDLNADLKKELKKVLTSSSKKIRTLVSILFLRASKMYLLPSHYELFSAIELVHNASLIHDDVIDESKNRRNAKTINEVFDNKLAVISGDYLLGVALNKLVKIGNMQVIEIFSQTIQICVKVKPYSILIDSKSLVQKYI